MTPPLYVDYDLNDNGYLDHGGAQGAAEEAAITAAFAAQHPEHDADYDYHVFALCRQKSVPSGEQAGGGIGTFTAWTHVNTDYIFMSTTDAAIDPETGEADPDTVYCLPESFLRKVIAHELGHAAFQFPDYYLEGSPYHDDTHNLMHTSGVKLRLHQWEEIHSLFVP